MRSYTKLHTAIDVAISRFPFTIFFGMGGGKIRYFCSYSQNLCKVTTNFAHMQTFGHFFEKKAIWGTKKRTEMRFLFV